MRSFLACGLACAVLVGAQSDNTDKFVIYSEPIELRYGQVHNKMQGVLPLPAEVVARYADGKTKMAVTSFTTDIVRIAADGTETSVPLYEAYLHHYILNLGTADSLGALRTAATNASDPDAWKLRGMKQGAALASRKMKHAAAGTSAPLAGDAAPLGGDALLGETIVSFGGAAGGEYRNNPHDFKAPFRMIIERPQVFLPTLHVINTIEPPTLPRKHNSSRRHTTPTAEAAGVAGGARAGAAVAAVRKSPLLQCPCTPQRKFNVSAGTIDGNVPYPPFGNCGGEIVGNPSCTIDGYVGGWRCCEHGVFLIDTDAECADPSCSENPRDQVRGGLVRG
jgi:hypothetical protein